MLQFFCEAGVLVKKKVAPISFTVKLRRERIRLALLIETVILEARGLLHLDDHLFADLQVLVSAVV